jgi:hypothetical protein
MKGFKPRSLTLTYAVLSNMHHTAHFYYPTKIGSQ